MNDAPSFTKGASQTVDEDAGPQTVTNWATSIAPGPADAADESGQVVDFVASANNAALFSAGPSVAADGTLTYTPAPNANGSATVTVFAHDSGSGVAPDVNVSSMQTFTITVNPINDAPGAQDQSVSTSEDTAKGITLTATDVDGDPLTLSIAHAPAHGSLGGGVTGLSCPAGSGTCTAAVNYTPDENYHGTDSFTFVASDGKPGDSPKPATVSIEVIAVNDAPVAGAQTVDALESTPKTLTLSASDVDGDSLTFAVATQPAHGTLKQIANPVCSGTTCTADVVYTPTTDYVGADGLTFEVSDGHLAGSAAVTINVTAGASSPVNATVDLRATPIPFDSTNPTQVQAGAREVPLADAAALVGQGTGPSSTPLSNTPLSNTPLSNTPLSNVPLANTPLSNTPLSNTGLTDPSVRALLSDSLLTTIPLAVPGGWPKILENTPLAGRPLQQLTVKDVLDDPKAGPRLGELSLHQVDFSLTPLGDLTSLAAILGTGIKLSDILLPTGSGSALDRWCAVLAAPPVGCDDATADLTGDSVMSASLEGAPLSNTPLSNTPLSNVPLANVPLANTPLSNTPLANTPLSNTGISGVPLANTPLSNVPLSNTPLSNTPLSNTPLANTPLSNTGITDIPLANTPLANTPLSNVALDVFPLSNVPLANTPLADTPLANTPLANTPLANVANPDAFFACGGSCPADGLIGTYPVRVGVTWGGFLHALDSDTVIPIAAIVRDAKVRSELPNVDLGTLLASLVSDARAQVTLAALLRAPNGPGDFLDLFTVLQLIDSVGRANATLADLVSLLLDPGAFGWERLDLSSARPQDLAGTKGGQVRYEADVRLAKILGPDGVKAPVTVAITVPPEFSFRRGTATLVELDGDGNPIAGSEVDLPDPTTPGAHLEWALKLKVGTKYRVGLTAQAGITLGDATAAATASPKFGNAGSDTATVVVVIDTFEPNDNFAAVSGGSAAINADSLFFSYIRSAGDVDLFTFKVPESAPEGTRVTFLLSHVPKDQDYDLVAYGAEDQLHAAVSGTPLLDAQPLGDSGPDPHPYERRARGADPRRHRPRRPAPGRTGGRGHLRVARPGGRLAHGRLTRWRRDLHLAGDGLQRIAQLPPVHVAGLVEDASRAAVLDARGSAHALVSERPGAVRVDRRPNRHRFRGCARPVPQGLRRRCRYGRRPACDRDRAARVRRIAERHPPGRRQRRGPERVSSRGTRVRGALREPTRSSGRSTTSSTRTARLTRRSPTSSSSEVTRSSRSHASTTSRRSRTRPGTTTPPSAPPTSRGGSPTGRCSPTIRTATVIRCRTSAASCTSRTRRSAGSSRRRPRSSIRSTPSPPEAGSWVRRTRAQAP